MPTPRLVPHSLHGAAVALVFVVVAALAPAASAAPRMLLLDAALAGDTVVAVGERGAIVYSADGGATWQNAVTSARATLTGVTFAPGGAPYRGWAVGHDALILYTTDSGRTWTRQFQGENLQDSFLDILAIDVQHVIAVGAYGLFAATTDGGKTWTRRRLGDDDFHFNRISRGPTGTLYLAGEHGTLLRSVDHGANWQPIPAAYEGSFYGILPLGERELLAYGLRGHVYRSTDDGATWTQIDTSLATSLATAVRTQNTILLAGQARTLLASADAGRTFAPDSNPPATAVAEMLILPDGRVLAVGEAGVAYLPMPVTRVTSP